jgi:hypothetical protein
MRRRPALLLGTAMLLVAGLVSAAAAAPPVPERLLLTADEWDLTVSRTTLAPGPAVIELYNRGEDPHDVRIKRRGSKEVIAIPETPSQELSRIETSLRPSSRYRLWCSLEGHRELGMEAELRTGPEPGGSRRKGVKR